MKGAYLLGSPDLPIQQYVKTIQLANDWANLKAYLSSQETERNIQESDKKFISIIRRFRRNGKSYKYIASHLNKRGLLNKTADDWTATTVRQVYLLVQL
jgi:hypothetical protein